jgi:UPF0271 protein
VDRRKEMNIDINCDMGESFGAWHMGEDEAAIQYITSANIACGWHAGDPMVMARTIELAKTHGVAVGAHPGYPDLLGFGRRHIETFSGEIKQYVLYQVGALSAIAAATGTRLQHVKPHGALYNLAARDERIATEVIEAVRAFNPELILVTLAGSLCAEMATATGLRVAREIFPDRAYLANGQLAPRTLAGAVVHDPSAVCERVVKLLGTGKITSIDGREISLRGDTMCVHGDTPDAWRLAKTIREVLGTSGIRVAAMGAVS